MKVLYWLLTAQDRLVDSQHETLQKDPEFMRLAEAAHRRDAEEGGNRHMHRLLSEWGY